MATSAKCTYSAVPKGGVYQYTIFLENTSSYPYDIYAFLFGEQFGVADSTPFPLQNIVGISSPFGWMGPIVGSYSMDWQTSWQGSAVLTGYIMPGQTVQFVFQSSTAPPVQLPFGCGFYNNGDEWGFGFNGTAYLVERRSPQVVPVIYNPWWWIETHGGLVPPGPSPPWLREFLAALAFAGDDRVSPQLRAGLLERALRQIPIASAAIKEEIEALRKK